MLSLAVNQPHNPTADTSFLDEISNRHSLLKSELADTIPHSEVFAWNHFVPPAESYLSMRYEKSTVKRGSLELFRIYTDGVVRKRTVGQHELAAEMRRLRTIVRMSREQVAEAGGLSVGPIKRIEEEGHIQKAPTLQQIANGMATYALGRRDDQLAGEFYDSLMRAAGYIEDRTADQAEGESRAAQVEDLTDDEVRDELERRLGDREVAVSLLAAVNNWRNPGPRSQRLILETVRYAAGEDDETAAPRRPRR